MRNSPIRTAGCGCISICPTVAATTGLPGASLSDVARETLLDADEHIRLDIFDEEIVGVLPDLHQEFMQEGDDLLRVHFAISSKADDHRPAQAAARDRADTACAR